MSIVGRPRDPARSALCLLTLRTRARRPAVSLRRRSRLCTSNNRFLYINTPTYIGTSYHHLSTTPKRFVTDPITNGDLTRTSKSIYSRTEKSHIPLHSQTPRLKTPPFTKYNPRAPSRPILIKTGWPWLIKPTFRTFTSVLITGPLVQLNTCQARGCAPGYVPIHPGIYHTETPRTVVNWFLFFKFCEWRAESCR